MEDEDDPISRPSFALNQRHPIMYGSSFERLDCQPQFPSLIVIYHCGRHVFVSEPSMFAVELRFWRYQGVGGLILVRQTP
jgi:hypothetical protein